MNTRHSPVFGVGNGMTDGSIWSRIDQAWRVLATGISFALFGLGGLVLRLLVFPAISMVIHDRLRESRFARWVIHVTFKAFVFVMNALGVLRYDIRGLEKLNRTGLLVLANHPTLIDVVFLISMIPNADCVVKASLAKNPFTRGPVRATNYIFNDAGPSLVEDCIASLAAGNNLIIFPEGTRTPENGEMKLQRGAANIAIRGVRNVTLVTIQCQPLCLTKGRAWWSVSARRPLFTFVVHDDIPIAPFIERANGEPALATRYFSEYLHHYFLEQKASHVSIPST